MLRVVWQDAIRANLALCNADKDALRGEVVAARAAITALQRDRVRFHIVQRRRPFLRQSLECASKNLNHDSNSFNVLTSFRCICMVGCASGWTGSLCFILQAVGLAVPVVVRVVAAPVCTST